MDPTQMTAQWEAETQRYEVRLKVIGDWCPKTPKEHETFVRGFHLSYDNNHDGLLALRYTLFASNVLSAIRPLCRAFAILWQDGLIGSAALPVRMVLEMWGAACFAKNGLESYLRTHDVQAAMEKTSRLLRGVRSDFDEPWGGKSPYRSYSVQSFIDALVAQQGAHWQGEYEYLCESCHPSNLQMTMWMLAQPWSNNLANQKYRARFHQDVDRVYLIAEQVIPGIVAVVEEIYHRAEPFIAAEVNKREVT